MGKTPENTASQESGTKQERFTRMYREKETPWELDRADQDLAAFVKDHPLAPCRAMDIGCGTGANAVWLAGQGFEMTGVDFSAPAVAAARDRAKAAGLDLAFFQMDFLSGRVDGQKFDFLFDRGCFHSFDDPDVRAAFARNAHYHLVDNGLWLSFIGNADAPPRKEGPPMRSALDIVRAVEPYFEILYLKSAVFDSNRETPARNWQCLMQKRTG